MDSNNGRPPQSDQPPMDGGDWRTQFQHESRQRIFNNIMEAFKRRLPFSGPEELQELMKIALRFEEKIYSTATSQSDYMRKIAIKVLTMVSESQNTLPLPSTSGGGGVVSRNSQDPGGESSLGHTKKDHYNFVTKMKMKAIESGDAQTLIDLLTSKGDEDPEFFYRVKLDDVGRLSSIFWRDSRMKEDYSIFGDVMNFDTTYRTNRYNLICAPFVGINNHWKNVMFGCAFLSDEKEETFVWLFETFKKAMLGLVPESIFTDQDQAMSNAIEKVFPDTRHRLCTWHIHKNAISHFGKLKRDSNFQDAFTKCLRFCSTEEEFYNSWNEMIKKFDLVNESWFKRLFELREKWCNALNKDYFSAGLLSSQRSESTNSAISFKANKTTSLIEFYHYFEETVRRWRSVENADEYSSFVAKLDTRVIMHSLQLHATDIYTREMFEDFDKEFQKAMCSNVTESDNDRNTKVYEVHLNGSKQTVCYTVDSKFITCSCKRFDEVKMLCYHIIRIMHKDSFEKIPEIYICDRWTKNARKKKLEEISNDNSSLRQTNSSTPWRHYVTRKFYNFLLGCEENLEARRMVEETMEQLMHNTKNTLQSNECSRSETRSDTSENIVLDPERAKTKGRNKRIKSSFEQKQKTRNVQNREFGTETPQI